jgi:SAM-dependent methyltransferase
MDGWSDGYFTDVAYTRHFFFQMAPGFMAFSCLRQGVRPPRLGPGSVYLELGCGHGFGLALMAAANPEMSFVGVDFHPGQIANGQRITHQTGLENLVLEELSFEQVLALPDGRIPKCDVIALHGVYSWISPENRGAIVRILDRLLKPGGMVYVSYNCLPGWAALAPLQRFMREYVARAPGPAEVEVLNSLRTARDMAEGKAQYFQGVPGLLEEIDRALQQPPAYLIHEYLNDHFHPLYHADVARELGGAKLTFAASASAAEDILHLAAPTALQARVRDAQDGTWRQTLLDYSASRRFRRDIFVRGRNAVGHAEREALLGEMRFALLMPPAAIGLEFAIPIGRMQGDPALYRPLIEALADQPRSFRDLTRLTGVPDAKVLQALTLLVSHGQAHPLPDGEVADRNQAAVRFNRALASGVVIEDGPYYVAAGQAGTAVRVTLSELLALGLASQKPADVKAAAARGWEIMSRTGVRLQRDGQALADQAANEAELMRRIEVFNREKLPLFRRLGVI